MHLPDVQMTCYVCDLCVINGFGLICNDMKRWYLRKDGIHLQDLGTSILSRNFIEFLNNHLINDPLQLLLTKMIT